MGDFTVHRLRIGNWTPSAIRSIAVDKFSNKIAVGRDNGDIEICDAAFKYCCQARIAGKKDFKLQSLTWSTDPQQRGRLFGVSLRGFIFEVNFEQLMIKNVCDSYGGTVWALAPSPREPLLAIGCEDGAVRLFQYEERQQGAKLFSDSFGSSFSSSLSTEAALDSGQLSYLKSLPSSGDRVLSVAYHPAPDLPRLFMGCGDGTIRCIDERTGAALFRMTGDVIKGSATTLIWTLQVLRDSTVISGDSRGQVQVWDGEVGVLMDSFRNHAADVISVCASPDEQFVYAAGVDGKVACLHNLSAARQQQRQRQRSNSNGNSHSDSGTASSSGTADLVEVQQQQRPRKPSEGTWVYVHCHRAHSHDVLTLAVCHKGIKSPKARRQTPSQTISASPARGEDEGAVQDCPHQISYFEAQRNGVLDGNWVLLSGGLDAKMCTYSVSNFTQVRPTWLGLVPTGSTSGVLEHSDDYSIVAVRHREHVDVWGVDMTKQQLEQKQQQMMMTRSPSSATGENGDDDDCGGGGLGEAGKDGGNALNVELRVRVAAKGTGLLHCCAVSPAGQYLAVSNVAGTRIYWLGSCGSGNSNDSRFQQAHQGEEGEQPSKKSKKLKASGVPVEQSTTVPPLHAPLKIQKLQLPAVLQKTDFSQAMTFFSPSEGVGPIFEGFACYCAIQGTIIICDLSPTAATAAATGPVAAGKKKPKRQEQLQHVPNVQLRHVIAHRSNILSSSLATAAVTASAASSSSLSSSTAEIPQSGLSVPDARLNASVVRMCACAQGRFLAVVSGGCSIYIYNMVSGVLHWKVPIGNNRVSDLKFSSFAATSRRSSADAARSEAEGEGATKETTSKNSGNKSKNKKKEQKQLEEDLSLGEVPCTCLMVSFANNTFSIFDVKSMRFHDWNAQHQHLLLPHKQQQQKQSRSRKSSLLPAGADDVAVATSVAAVDLIIPPAYIQNLSAPICGLAVSPSEPNKLMFYSQGYCVYADLNIPKIPTVPQVAEGCTSKVLKATLGIAAERAAAKKNRNKRKLGQVGDAVVNKGEKISNYVVFNAYRNLLHVGMLPDNQMVVVENPWLHIMASLPDTLARKRYGT